MALNIVKQLFFLVHSNKIYEAPLWTTRWWKRYRSVMIGLRVYMVHAPTDELMEEFEISLSQSSVWKCNINLSSVWKNSFEHPILMWQTVFSEPCAPNKEVLFSYYGFKWIFDTSSRITDDDARTSRCGSVHVPNIRSRSFTGSTNPPPSPTPSVTPTAEALQGKSAIFNMSHVIW